MDNRDVVVGAEAKTEAGSRGEYLTIEPKEVSHLRKRGVTDCRFTL